MTSTVVLRTEESVSGPALTLRPWLESDMPAVLAAFEDRAMRRWLTSWVDDEAEAARWLGRQRQGWADGDRLAFAVVGPAPGARDRADGVVGERVLGNVVLKGAVGGARSAEVGYWTVPAARGFGVAPRALTALTGWAFATFGPAGLERLELLHQEDNAASCAVAEKCGYALRGVLPAAPPDHPRDGHLHVRHAQV
ncbi:GNAT family N-acetyltransferase [Streptomyces avicenniae]|uniref:GNAT family N-acetyltransferase n=1 Tax=Streptomyces avicenniae TaxID=500153 RepID=UPI00069AA0AE|nr:GNAT family N-acetyltransferase [Streptomyces avicenniae]